MEIEEQGRSMSWIPVEKRMPKKSGDVLAYFGHGDMAVVYAHVGPVAYQKTLSHEWLGVATHWMPLPEPPEEKNGHN